MITFKQYLKEAKYHRENHVVEWIKQQYEEIMSRGTGWDELNIDDSDWSDVKRDLTAAFGQPKYNDQGHGLETFEWKVDDVKITMIFLTPDDPQGDFDLMVNVAHVDMRDHW